MAQTMSGIQVHCWLKVPYENFLVRASQEGCHCWGCTSESTESRIKTRIAVRSRTPTLPSRNTDYQKCVVSKEPCISMIWRHVRIIPSTQLRGSYCTQNNWKGNLSPRTCVFISLMTAFPEKPCSIGTVSKCQLTQGLAVTGLPTPLQKKTLRSWRELQEPKPYDDNFVVIT